MSTQEMTTELFRQLAIVSEDEDMMKRAIKALKRITKPKEDPTLMTKEEFFRRVDEGREQIRQGKYSVMLPDESLEQHLRRIGYDL